MMSLLLYFKIVGHPILQPSPYVTFSPVKLTGFHSMMISDFISRYRYFMPEFFYLAEKAADK